MPAEDQKVLPLLLPKRSSWNWNRGTHAPQHEMDFSTFFNVLRKHQSYLQNRRAFRIALFQNFNLSSSVSKPSHSDCQALTKFLTFLDPNGDGKSNKFELEKNTKWNVYFWAINWLKLPLMGSEWELGNIALLQNCANLVGQVQV